MIECLFCEITKQELDEIVAHIDKQHNEPFYSGSAGQSFRCYCDNCGTEFERGASQIASNQYCSRQCASDGYRRDTDAEQTYGERFDRARSWRLEIDDRMCVDCGFPQLLHEDIYGEGLHAHHIQRVSEFQNPDEAHTVSNLRMLCRQCHNLRHYRD